MTPLNGWVLRVESFWQPCCKWTLSTESRSLNSFLIHGFPLAMHYPLTVGQYTRWVNHIPLGLFNSWQTMIAFSENIMTWFWLHQHIFRAWSNLYKFLSTQQSSGVDEDVITEVAVHQGKSRVAVRQAVCRWGYDYLTATYLLMMAQKRTGRTPKLLPGRNNLPYITVCL